MTSHWSEAQAREVARHPSLARRASPQTSDPTELASVACGFLRYRNFTGIRMARSAKTREPPTQGRRGHLNKDKPDTQERKRGANAPHRSVAKKVE